VEAAFIDSGGNSIFALLRVPKAPKGCVLVVPPFAEEMNKCRRQVTETALLLEKEGFAVLTVDLTGTGDSGGEFSGASWVAWQNDVEAACQWVEAMGLNVSGVIAIRLGCCLLASSFAKHEREVSGAVFWQPVENGSRYMAQFLRLRVATSLMEGRADETTDNLRARLENGETLEIGGYSLSPQLWREIETATIEPQQLRALGTIALLEIGPRESDQLSVANRRLAERASDSGVTMTGQRFAGDPFWSATEIVVNEALQQQTVTSLKSAIE
jgi:exosortase A-associated hydrolase 2